MKHQLQRVFLLVPALALACASPRRFYLHSELPTLEGDSNLMVGPGPWPDVPVVFSDPATIPDDASLAVDGGTVAPSPRLEEPDAGSGASRPSVGGLDAGTAGSAESIRWPEDLRPLATLDGPAVPAAHAALQHLLARLAKEGAMGCGSSAKAMEVLVGQEGGLYFVRIDQRMDRCGWRVPPGFSTQTDWFELYAVSLEGQVLARAPFAP
jgi:hypothetical protein